MKIDPKELSRQDSSHLLTDIIVPRPIAWVSTVDENGLYNLAPFSAYGMVSTDPMVLGFSVGSYRHGQKKDTLINVQATKEFVVCVVTEELAEKMNVTSAAYPHGVSEFEKAGLTPVKADLVKAPLVADSPVNMECQILQIIDFGKPPVTMSLILGLVIRVHIADEFYDKKTKRIQVLRPVARLGGEGDLYCYSRETFEMKRPVI